MNITEKLFSYIVGDIPEEDQLVRLIFFPLLFLCVITVFKYGSTAEAELPLNISWLAIVLFLVVMTIPFFMLGWLIYKRTPLQTQPGKIILGIFFVFGLIYGGPALAVILSLGYLAVLGGLQLIALPIIHQKTVIDSMIRWSMLVTLAVITAPVFISTVLLFPVVTEVLKRAHKFKALEV